MRLILIIVVFLFGMLALAALFFRAVLNYLKKSFSQQGQRKTGETHVDYIPKEFENRQDNKLGDYVDFEDLNTKNE